MSLAQTAEEKCDKKSALELLGRHLGMWNDKLDVKGVEGVVIVDDIPKPKDTG